MSTSKHKLYFTEVTPPLGVWTSIEAALDDRIASHEFPLKLYKMEAEPPAAAWTGIVAGLNASKKVVKIPLHKPVFPMAIRYVAAAVLCGLVAIFILRLTQSTSTRQAETANAQPVINLPALNTQANTSAPVAQEIMTQPVNSVAVSFTSNGSMPVRKTVSSKAKASDEWNDRQYQNAQNAVTCTDVQNEDCWYEDHKASINNNYITLLNSDKKEIRISKKLGHLECCIAGEGSDSECTETVKKYQNKLAQISPSHTGANALELLKIIQSMEK